MKKHISLLLCLVMLLSVTTLTFAVGNDSNSTKAAPSVEDTIFYGFNTYDPGGRPYGWLTFTRDTLSDPQVVANYSQLVKIHCAIYVDGMIYGFTKEKNYCRIDPSTWELAYVSPNEGFAFYDMTYDYSTETAYATHYGESLNTVNLTTGEITYIGEFGGDFITRDCSELWSLECTTDGTMYGIGNTGDLFRIDKETCECKFIGNVGYDDIYYRQSMAYDHYNGIMYWSIHRDIGDEYNYGRFATVNLETGEIEELGVLGGELELTCLIIPYEPDGDEHTTNPEPYVPEPGRVLLEEDFDGSQIQWAVVDNDGDGENWGIFSAQSSHSPAHSGGRYAGSESWLSGQALTPDNWLISPAFYIPNDGLSYFVNYWVAGFSADSPAEHYSVMIVNIQHESMDEFTCLFSETLDSAEYVNREVDLTSFKGKTVYIAFRHHDCTDQQILKLDTIKVYNPTESDDPTPTPVTEHTVTFVDGVTGDTINTATVNHGEDVATFPEVPEHVGYTFKEWDNDGKNIVADTTITAIYEESYVLGDVNDDETINTGDAALVLKYAAEMNDFDDIQMLAADFNKDGLVNTGDAVSILVYVVEL